MVTNRNFIVYTAIHIILMIRIQKKTCLAVCNFNAPRLSTSKLIKINYNQHKTKPSNFKKKSHNKNTHQGYIYQTKVGRRNEKKGGRRLTTRRCLVLMRYEVLLLELHDLRETIH